MMLGSRPRPVIAKLSALLVSGGKMKTQQSFKKQYDMGRVGLGIVAELGEEHASCSGLTLNRCCSKTYKQGGLELESNTYNKRPNQMYYSSSEDFSFYPTSDFLNSCHLCNKKLHGKDIYMYRGEKAFCSTECRSRQILMDERQEQCRSDVMISGSPYTRDHQIFSTGIIVI